MSGGAYADKAAVDHNGDLVAEGFGLVHPVSRQHYRRFLQVLQHLEQTTA